MARASLAVPSARSVYRPSQKKLSATRLGRSPPPRESSAGAVVGRSRLKLLTGPPARIHVSLLSPPGRSERALLSSAPPTLERAPGITSYESPETTRYARIHRCAGASSSPLRVGTVDRTKGS